jgi:hypothetical protein
VKETESIPFPPTTLYEPPPLAMVAMVTVQKNRRVAYIVVLDRGYEWQTLDDNLIHDPNTLVG